jgi:hypothetical protein
MYKVKLFSGGRTDLLQNAINEWLQVNKDILIHSSNLTGSNGEKPGSNEYNFCILYSGPDEQAEELKEMAAAVTQNQSIEVKEINPEIMKPSS